MDTAFLENVQKIVVEEILAGKYLTEQNLAGRLGVSRTPIREALTLLERQGVLERKKYHGIKLRRVSMKDLTETYDLRIALEGMAARLLASRIDRETIEKLRALAETADRLTNTTRTLVQESNRVDLQFHQMLIDKSGNTRLKNFLDVFCLIDSSFCAQVYLKADNSSPVRKHRFNHRQIVEALESRDPDKAERVTRLHIQEAREHLLQDVLEFAYPLIGNSESGQAAANAADLLSGQTGKE